MSPPEAQPDSVVTGAHQTGLERVERDAIGSAIRLHRGNLTRVARDLGIAKSTLYLKMKRYTLEPIVDEVRRSAQ